VAGASRSETKRRYGREYMRRWRSLPKNRLRERLNRERWHWLRKVRAADYGGPEPVKTGRRIEPASAIAPRGGRRKESGHLAKSFVKARRGAVSKASFRFAQDECHRPFGSEQGKQDKFFGRPQDRHVSRPLRQLGRYSSGQDTKASGEAAHNSDGRIHSESAHAGRDLSCRGPACGRSARQAGVTDIGGNRKAGVRVSRYTFRNARGNLVCGFCRYRAPVREVVRLRVDEKVPGGYVKVRVPYCGEC
jgi:hypothetical protein